MKVNKKILTALLTASCISISAFAFAACNNNPGNDDNPPKEEDKPIELKDGVNAVTLTGDKATTGVTYNYKAATNGTYAFAVVGTNAQVKVNGNAIANNCYTATLNADQTLSLVCASLSGDSEYSVVVGASMDWTLGAGNTVNIPKSGLYNFGKLSVTTEGYYDFDLSNAANRMADYKIIVNGNEYKTNANGHFTVNLPAGEHAVGITSNLAEAQASGTIDVTVSPFTSKTVNLGANEITLESSDYYFGIDYTFIAPETGLYSFSLSGDNGDALVISEKYDPFIEGTSSREIVLAAGELFTVTCMSNKDRSVATHTYTLNIAQAEYSNIVEIDSNDEKPVILENNSAVIKVTPSVAGKFILSVYDANAGDNITIKVGDGEPDTKTAVNNRINTVASFTIDLTATETEISIEVSSNISMVNVFIQTYNN